MKLFGILIFGIIGLASCSHFNKNDQVLSRYIASVDEGEKEIYPYRVHSNSNHEMRIINNGIAAIYERIRMIRSAKTKIEMEYFIFNPDQAGRLIVSELSKAAERGVKVRVLVDKSMAVFKMDEYFAEQFKSHNIEIRYYNPASALQISSVQFRNHRKLISVDDSEAITGGRNIADEYFNLAHEFNFLDRDVWVKGEIVQAMKDTFDIYWNSSIVETPSPVTAPKMGSLNPKNTINPTVEYNSRLKRHKQSIEDARKMFMLTDEDTKALEFILNYGASALNENNKGICNNIAFATDREGGNFKTRIESDNYNKNYRLLRKEIAAWMSKIKHEVILDSPYFLNDSNSREIVDNLLNSGKHVTIFTNSLASTDAIYVSTVFNDEVKKYTPNENFNAYIYKGTFSNESDTMNDEIRKSMWGTHSKTIVFSDEAFMIGTFNVDNRSNFYNSEMALFCEGNSDLVSDIDSNIKLRMKNSLHLNKDGKPDDGSGLLDGNSKFKKLEYFILKVPSHIMNFLL